MKNKTVIVILVILVGIFCVSKIGGSDSESTEDTSPSYTLKSYADTVEGGVDIDFGDDSSVSGYTYDFSGGSASSKTECPICDGSGKKVCSGCNGSGRTSSTKSAANYGYGSSSYTVSSRCIQCNGSGKTPCTYCGGDGLL